MLKIKTVYFIVFILVIFTCCKSNKFSSLETLNYNNAIWHHNDFAQDSVYGTSLNKWYAENIQTTNNEIIVATIDTQIDINHEGLKDQIWVNKDEIPNNGIDDDKNGYIDDVNGWNFRGKPNGSSYLYCNYEAVRIIRNKDNVDPEIFKKAHAEIEEEINAHKRGIKSLTLFKNLYGVINDSLKTYFPNGIYTYKQLDSLYQLKKINDKLFQDRRNDYDTDIGALISYKKSLIDFQYNSMDLINKQYKLYDSIINRNLSVNFNDRELIGDNPTILEKGYGNNNLTSDIRLQKHNTEVSSIIIGNRNNKSGLKGFHNSIKLMPLSISVSGDEDDKDIAMAIYYAVDNGAKIINMSFGKRYSLKQEWVTEAFKYAEKHNVLLVHCSGNNRFDVDKNPYYPSDYSYKDSIELVSNFINVGSISKRTDSTMVSPFSNYGKQNVDIFAPGEEIYVAQPNDKYGYDSGTSLAGPMVSGTAALIWLYYPKLTVQEVKEIILESGVSVDKKVVKPGTQGELVPFSELSKTGKVLNVYNAMELAKLKSKKK